MIPQFTFPCRASNMAPCLKEWQKSAFQWVTWKRAELVGAATGERNAFDVLDVDPRNGGVAWYDRNFDALPRPSPKQARADCTSTSVTRRACDAHGPDGDRTRDRCAG